MNQMEINGEILDVLSSLCDKIPTLYHNIAIIGIALAISLIIGYILYLRLDSRLKSVEKKAKIII